MSASIDALYASTGAGHHRPVLEARLEELLVLQVELDLRLVLAVLREVTVDHDRPPHLDLEHVTPIATQTLRPRRPVLVGARLDRMDHRD
jgi:hypothetical protein